jgi:hypothetical protein
MKVVSTLSTINQAEASKPLQQKKMQECNRCRTAGYPNGLANPGTSCPSGHSNNYNAAFAAPAIIAPFQMHPTARSASQRAVRFDQ